MTLLNKVLKYTIPKQSLQTLAIEADTAISLIAPQDQPYMRQAVAQKIKNID
jgi:hypothetical protein